VVVVVAEWVKSEQPDNAIKQAKSNITIIRFIPFTLFVCTGPIAPHNYLCLADPEYLGTTWRASPLGSRFPILHCYCFGSLDFFLRLAFNTISLYHFTLLFVYLSWTVHYFYVECQYFECNGHFDELWLSFMLRYWFTISSMLYFDTIKEFL
jgi:hypothetical protein